MTHDTKNPVRTVFTIVAVLILAGLVLVLAFSAVAAPNTCDAAGYPEANKVEGNPSEMSGQWGTVTADGTEVVFDVEALWQVEVCVKAGPDLVEVVATSLTESLFTDHDVSHMSWRNPTPPPSETPSPSPTSTATPTGPPTSTPTPTTTGTPSPSPTVTSTPTPTETPTWPTESPTETASPTPSDTSSPRPTDTSSPTPSSTPSPTVPPPETHRPTASPSTGTPSTPSASPPTSWSSATAPTGSTTPPSDSSTLPTAEPAEPVHDDPTYTG